MDNKGVVDQSVITFFEEHGCKEMVKTKLIEGGFPADKFEEAWPRLAGSLAFFLASKVLEAVSDEAKQRIMKQSPEKIDVTDMSLFTSYFMAVLAEVRTLPVEKIDEICLSVADLGSGNVIKGYQMGNKYVGN